MHFSGEYAIPAPKDTVWAGLNDPDILKACIPGCEKLDKTSDTELVAAVTVKIGPVKAKMDGSVTLSELDAPNSYRIDGQGKGATGFAKGGAKVSLAEDDGGTKLTYEADAQLGGKLAQMGGRLLQGAAKKYADDFFSAFSQKVAGSTVVDAETGTVIDAPASTTSASTTPAAEPAREAAEQQVAQPEPPAAPSHTDIPKTAPEADPVVTGTAPAQSDPAEGANLSARVALLQKQVNTLEEQVTAMQSRLESVQPGVNPWIWSGAVIIIVALLITIFG